MPNSLSNKSDRIPPSFVIESTENGGIYEVLDQFSADDALTMPMLMPMLRIMHLVGAYNNGL